MAENWSNSKIKQIGGHWWMTFFQISELPVDSRTLWREYRRKIKLLQKLKCLKLKIHLIHFMWNLLFKFTYVADAIIQNDLQLTTHNCSPANHHFQDCYTSCSHKHANKV